METRAPTADVTGEAEAQMQTCYTETEAVEVAEPVKQCAELVLPCSTSVPRTQPHPQSGGSLDDVIVARLLASPRFRAELAKICKGESPLEKFTSWVRTNPVLFMGLVILTMFFTDRLLQRRR